MARHHQRGRSGQRRRRLAGVTGVVVLVTLAVTTFRSEPDGRVVLEPPAPRATGDPIVPPEVGEPPLPDLPVSAASGSPAATVPAAVAPPAARPAPPRPAAPVAPGPAPRFAAVTGESCGQTASGGYWYRGWAKDWYAKPSGGWGGDGCAGRVIAVPMSGDPDRDDPDNVIVWWFRPPAGSTCAVAMYVPGTGGPLDAAGAPATYFVYASASGDGPQLGRFGIDQVHNQGRWVGGGSYPAATGQLSVRLVTRGIDWGPGRAGAHLGVSAARLTCT
jgi:hypothetical protein